MTTLRPDLVELEDAYFWLDGDLLDFRVERNTRKAEEAISAAFQSLQKLDGYEGS